MKKFDYQTLNNLVITPEMVKKLNQISELRGRKDAIQVQNPPVLDRLIEVAKVQSTDASNRIEGVYTSDTRLKQLVNKKTTPHNRSEEEISGYRDVLDLIHNQYEYIPLNSSSILTLHKDLFSFTASTWGGHFKDIDNEIITQYSDGKTETRFTPPAAFITPELVDSLCDTYKIAKQEDEIPELLLCGAFIFDFVSIHPFRDGNGRMSRLLMLLTMYQSGYNVGQYISLESLIEKTKSQYYASLEESSTNWHENTNSYQPFLNYFLSIVLQAYRELDELLNHSNTKKTAPDLIIQSLNSQLKPLSKSELLELIPSYSQTTIERSLSTLLKDKKIKKIGQGRSTKYIVN